MTIHKRKEWGIPKQRRTKIFKPVKPKYLRLHNKISKDFDPKYLKPYSNVMTIHKHGECIPNKKLKSHEITQVFLKRRINSSFIDKHFKFIGSQIHLQNL